MLDRLARRFSATQLLRTSDRAEVLRAGGPAREWVIARSRCAYALFDCAHVPRKERAGFLAISTARWAPFADPAFHVAWAGDAAMVWAWPRSDMADPQDMDYSPGNDHGLPESVFLGQPEASGVLIQQCVEGFEGRAWRDGVLQASAWWPELPGPDDWNRFLRGAGLAAAGPVPAPVELPRLATPWVARRGTSLGELGRRHRGSLQAAAAGLVAFVFAWQVGAMAPLAWKHVAIASELGELEPGLAPILDAREAADRDLAKIERLLSLRPARGQMALMAEAVRVFPATVRQVTQWRYSSDEGLQVMVSASNPDPQPIVQALEESPLFESVTAEPGDGPDRIRVRARITAVERGP